MLIQQGMEPDSWFQKTDVLKFMLLRFHILQIASSLNNSNFQFLYAQGYFIATQSIKCSQIINNSDNLVYKMHRIIPRRGDFRMRAHINPFNTPFFPFPPHPTYVDWKLHFPLHFQGDVNDPRLHCNTDQYPCTYSHPVLQPQRKIDFLDVGCGYGGLLFALSQRFSSKLIFGLEIRDKLVNYAAEKIRAYKTLYPGEYQNISVVRANSMKHLCHYLFPGTVQKIFICFPDPHFKGKNFKRRIVSTGFLSEYAYLMKPEGRIYCITDVQDLHQWHLQHLHNHSMFREVTDPNDSCIDLILNSTEQGQKVTRNSGKKFWAIFERIRAE